MLAKFKTNLMLNVSLGSIIHPYRCNSNNWDQKFSINLSGLVCDPETSFLTGILGLLLLMFILGKLEKVTFCLG